MKMFLAIIVLITCNSTAALTESKGDKLIKDYRYRVDSDGDIVLEGVSDSQYNGRAIHAACYEAKSKKFLGNGNSFVRAGNFTIYINDVGQDPKEISCTFSVE